MSSIAGFDPDRLLTLARAGSVADLGDLLEGYRSYLTLLARLEIGRRLQGKVDAADFCCRGRGSDLFYLSCFLALLRLCRAKTIALQNQDEERRNRPNKSGGEAPPHSRPYCRTDIDYSRIGDAWWKRARNQSFCEASLNDWTLPLGWCMSCAT
jgi:hypothetical protein